MTKTPASRAHLHSLRASARKVRVVLDLIRGKPVEEAYHLLAFQRRRQAETVLKLLKSAVANATAGGTVKPADLAVGAAYADAGFSQGKLEPKAMLRHGIQKMRTCHVTIELVARGGEGGS